MLRQRKVYSIAPSWPYNRLGSLGFSSLLMWNAFALAASWLAWTKASWLGRRDGQVHLRGGEGERGKAIGVQCDQFGRFIQLWASF